MTGTALRRAHLADTAHPRHEERIASVGVAQTPVRIRVAGPDGQALPVDEVGEVLIQGDSVMSGYWQNPEATQAAIRDGWRWTPSAWTRSPASSGPSGMSSSRRCRRTTMGRC